MAQVSEAAAESSQRARMASESQAVQGVAPGGAEPRHLSVGSVAKSRSRCVVIPDVAPVTWCWELYLDNREGYEVFVHTV